MLYRLICNLVPFATDMIYGRHLGFQNYPTLIFSNVIQLTCTLIWQVNLMLLLILCAYQYSLYNNIVIMCVMYKETRNRENETECYEEWTRKGQHTFSYCTLSPHAPLHLQSSVHCRFDKRHLHWRLQPFLVRSMQWTPLVVQSKRVSIQNQM